MLNVVATRMLIVPMFDSPHITTPTSDSVAVKKRTTERVARFYTFTRSHLHTFSIVGKCACRPVNLGGRTATSTSMITNMIAFPIVAQIDIERP